MASHEKSRKLPRPLVMVGRAVIDCKPVDSLKLVPVADKLSDQGTILQENKNYLYRVEAYDNERNKFYNFSSSPLNMKASQGHSIKPATA